MNFKCLGIPCLITRKLRNFCINSFELVWRLGTSLQSWVNAAGVILQHVSSDPRSPNLREIFK